MSLADPVSGPELAQLLGVTPRRVQQLAGDGIIPRAKRGEYLPLECVPAYARWLRAGGDAASAEGLDGALEAARLTRARADLAEMDRDERRRLLVRRDAVEKEARTVLLEIRTTLLALPARVAARAAGGDERRIKTVATDEVTQALRTLADRASVDDAETDVEGDE